MMKTKNAPAIGQSASVSVGADTNVLSLNRPALEAAIETLIGVLDWADGEADYEANGTEEDFVLANCQLRDGPGCDISDPGGSQHDGRKEEGGI